MRLCSILFVWIVLLAGGASAQSASTDDYVWASGCKDCHAAIYKSWEQTKHARTITRLSESERTSACAACHTTAAADTRLPNDVNANVQCERCHGAGKAHVQAAASGAAKPGSITRKPSEAVCVECHSQKSPHFNFFSYTALAGLVHPHQK